MKWRDAEKSMMDENVKSLMSCFAIAKTIHICLETETEKVKMPII